MNFVNKGSDFELLKSLNQQGLVQKEILGGLGGESN